MAKADRYPDVVARFRALLERVVPPGLIVAVVSKGDGKLLVLPGRRGWHFPQRPDGVYAGYYPSDSASAIAHLESLRSKGATFIAFPSTALWWLDEYAAFGRHLLTTYPDVVHEGGVGRVFGLWRQLPEAAAEGGADAWNAPPSHSKHNVLGHDGASKVRPQPEASAASSSTRLGCESSEPTEYRGKQLNRRTARSATAGLDDVRHLFDAAYYAEQLGTGFPSFEAALAHYLESDDTAEADPHPLFDEKWYLRHQPAAASARKPLLHFLEYGTTNELDPSPYFDTHYYYSQKPRLRAEGRNALVHYAKLPRPRDVADPNPLFQDAYYTHTYADVDTLSTTPLEHFLRRGSFERRTGSALHHNMLTQAQTPTTSLLRGKWRSGTVVIFVSGNRRDSLPDASEIARLVGQHYHLDSVIVARRDMSVGQGEIARPSIVLEDYALAADVLRPSALRLLARSLGASRASVAVSEESDVLGPLGAVGVPTIYLLPEHADLPPTSVLEEAFLEAKRVVARSDEAVRAAAARVGHELTNQPLVCKTLADADPSPAPGVRFARSLVALTKPIFEAYAPRPSARPAAAPNARPKVLIPCSDWAVSGVNASLEAIGQELVRLGWDIEIVFTRSKETVLESALGANGLPSLPHRYLRRNKPGITGMWEALIADLETHGQCLLFTSYDFLANSVAPALTEKVGVVAWLQADDGDYYEQAYRLGLYCNAVVCVSEHIRARLTELNPAIGRRASVVHNSSISSKDVVSRRRPRAPVIRLVYAGRLVEYQKRVLDFVRLARALDATGKPYELSLIGSFPWKNEEERFTRQSVSHLRDGRIRLLGRMRRTELLGELSQHDFFVLVSDFEGLPLSLIEAMARGCVPVAATTRSGVPDLITSGVNGLIMTSRDYREWADLIVELSGDRRRLAKMSRSARAKVRSSFTVETVAREFSGIFHQVAQELATGSYERPPALHWGELRSELGDVLPPPVTHRPSALRWPGLE